jgi:hypothetical protein
VIPHGTGSDEDALVDRLRSLRELSWDRPDHRRALEQKIMSGQGGRMRRWRWLTGKAALIVGLVVLGGMAAGATTMWIVQEISVEPGTSDGQGNCTWIIHHEDGSTEETEMLPEDTGWLTVDDDDGGGTSLIGVTPCDPPEGSADVPVEPEPAPVPAATSGH